MEILGVLAPTEKAFNGKEAIEKLKTMKKDCCGGLKVAFLDANMPLKNGIETAKELRLM